MDLPCDAGHGSGKLDDREAVGKILNHYR